MTPLTGSVTQTGKMAPHPQLVVEIACSKEGIQSLSAASVTHVATGSFGNWPFNSVQDTRYTLKYPSPKAAKCLVNKARGFIYY